MKSMERKLLVVVASILATGIIALIFFHLIYPSIAIDTTILGLFGLLILVCMIPFSKSIGLPGGGKIDLSDDLEEAKKTVDEVEKESKQKPTPYRFLSPSPEDMTWIQIVKNDPNIGLAGLRIRIEENIRQLAKKNDIAQSEIEPLGSLTKRLRQNEKLSLNEFLAIQQVTKICNKAVHAQDLSSRDVDLAVELGEDVLGILDSKLKG